MAFALTFDREAIYAALFALVSPTSVYPWVGTPARRLKLWADVPLDQRPILYQFEGVEETYKWANNYAAPIVTIEAHLFAYINAKDVSIVGSTQINQILNALHNALAPTGADIQRGKNTLGGLVQWCRIDGKIFRDPGDIDGDGLVRVPVLINVNGP
jgi:hypothetical protein